jgi:TusA-related sulfurtransferase
MKKAMEAMERLAPEEILEVAVDHPPAIETIRMAANRFGFSMEVYSVGSGEWRLILRRQIREVNA